MKKASKSKTIVVNSLVVSLACLVVLQEWLATGDFSAVGIVALAISLTNVVLRFFTKEAIY